MNNYWVLSVRTSLPEVCDQRECLNTVFYVYESFDAARSAFRDTVRRFAFGENTMFDGKGNIRMLNKYLAEAGQYFEDTDIPSLLNCLQKAFEGDAVSIDGICEWDTDWMIAFKREGDTLSVTGYDDGPINGYDPFIKTNIFNMEQEQHYYLYINDLLGQDCSSELYIDLKRSDN